MQKLRTLLLIAVGLFIIGNEITPNSKEEEDYVDDSLPTLVIKWQGDVSKIGFSMRNKIEETLHCSNEEYGYPEGSLIIHVGQHSGLEEEGDIFKGDSSYYKTYLSENRTKFTIEPLVYKIRKSRIIKSLTECMANLFVTAYHDEN